MTKYEALHARNEYQSLQNDIIPVVEKRPIGNEWQLIPNTDWLFQKLPARQQVNIGLRCNTVQVIDADNEQTAQNINHFLDKLGYHDTPLERTTKGTHFFIKIKDKPIEGNRINLGNDLKGELHYSKGTQCVIAPSTVNGITRQLEYSTPSTLINDVPILEWTDIIPILSKDMPSKVQTIANLDPYLDPVPRHIDNRSLLYKHNWVVDGLKLGARKYTKPFVAELAQGKFLTCPSRSEFEFTLIHYAYSLGFTFEEIKGIFTKHGGHYSEHPGDFKRDYKNILTFDRRPEIYNRWTDVQNGKLLPGNNLINDVYSVLLSVAWQFNRLNFYFSYEQIAKALDFTDTNKMKLQRSISALETSGLIKLNKGFSTKRTAAENAGKMKGNVRLPNQYELCTLSGLHDYNQVRKNLENLYQKDIKNLYTPTY